MQALLRDWYQRNTAPLRPDGRWLDQFKLDWFHEMNRALNDHLDDAAFAQRIRDNVARMRWLAREMLAEARRNHPAIPDHGLDALLAVGENPPPSLDATWYARTTAEATAA
jgi:hypothetical protein